MIVSIRLVYALHYDRYIDGGFLEDFSVETAIIFFTAFYPNFLVTSQILKVNHGGTVG